jgi:hypothetical protein
MKILSPKEEGLGLLGRLVMTVLIVAAILVATAALAVRTKGGRSFIEDRLTKQLGVETSIERARIGWPCALVLEGATSKRFSEKGGPGFAAQEVRVAVGLRPALRIWVRRCKLNLQRAAEEGWDPAGFKRVGGLPEGSIADLSRITVGLRESAELHVSDSTVRWMDEEGSVLAAANGVAFDLAPVRVPGRDMYHYALSVYDAAGLDGRRARDVRREWLASDAHVYVELQRSDPDGPGAATGFWAAEGAADGPRSGAPAALEETP